MSVCVCVRASVCVWLSSCLLSLLFLSFFPGTHHFRASCYIHSSYVVATCLEYAHAVLDN